MLPRGSSFTSYIIKRDTYCRRSEITYIFSERPAARHTIPVIHHERLPQPAPGSVQHLCHLQHNGHTLHAVGVALDYAPAILCRWNHARRRHLPKFRPRAMFAFVATFVASMLFLYYDANRNEVDAQIAEAMMSSQGSSLLSGRRLRTGSHDSGSDDGSYGSDDEAEGIVREGAFGSCIRQRNNCFPDRDLT